MLGSNPDLLLATVWPQMDHFLSTISDYFLISLSNNEHVYWALFPIRQSLDAGDSLNGQVLPLLGTAQALLHIFSTQKCLRADDS